MLTTFNLLGTALTGAGGRNSKVAFSEGMKMVPSAGRKLFKPQYVSSKLTESDSVTYDPVAAETLDGADYASSDPVKGYNLILTQTMFTQSFEATKAVGMYAQSNGEQYDVIKILGGIQGLGSACAKRLEQDLQLLIGMGTGDKYVNRDGNTVSTLSADGANIFSNSHTTRSGTGYDNLDSTAFGQIGIETHEDLWRNFVNHDGQLVDQMPNAIFSTTKSQLCNLIEEYLNSNGHVEDDNHGVNTYGYKGARYEHIKMEYLDCTNVLARDSTKDDYWGLVVKNADEHELKISQDPIVYPPQLVQRNRNVLIQTDCHYSYGIRDAFKISLSNA